MSSICSSRFLIPCACKTPALSLVERRYFHGSTWHRVVPNFVVQDGDPRGDGWGGPGFASRDETNPPHLDGTYTVFGRVVSGLGALAAIGQGEHIRSIHR